MVGGKYGNASRLLEQRRNSEAMKNGGEDLTDQISRHQFGFRTPNKKNMLEKTSNILAASPTTPSSRPSSASMTPTARRAVMNRMALEGTPTKTPKRGRGNGSPKQQETPIRRMALRVKENDPPTPASTRKRVAKSMAKVVKADEEDSEDEEDEDTTDKDTDSEEEVSPKKKVRMFSSKSVSSSSKATTSTGTPIKWTTKGNQVLLPCEHKKK